MSRIKWDQPGTRKYSLGVSNVVLYKYNKTSNKWLGVPWTGVSNVTQSPEGGEANDIYADNILYASMRGTEKMSGSIEAYDYPDEFEECIGGDELAPGMVIRQQTRANFCLCYRTEVGESNDPMDGYKLHIIYDCTANAAERVAETINDSPDTEPYSFDFDSVPVPVTGKKPTSTIEIDMSGLTTAQITALENKLYGTDAEGGTAGTDAELLMPDGLADLIRSAA